MREKLDWDKGEGLLPAVIQDAVTLQVRMVGFMNEEAFDKTLETKKVTFYSRSKKRLWQKGEESGNVLNVVDVVIDCDQDTILVKVNPVGPTCHLGTQSCFGEEGASGFGFLGELEEVVAVRQKKPDLESYTSDLFKKGLNKIAQKVGEEGVEVVIAALNETDEDFKNEVADLMFHLLVLCREKNINFSEVIDVLRARHK